MATLSVNQLPIKRLCRKCKSLGEEFYVRKQNSHVQAENAKFGLLFDIDGVIVRGRRVLPSAMQAFKKLVDSQNKFRIPTAFVTNAGNAMRHQKAQELTNWLGVEIKEDQVVMAHSPLKMFKQFHNKHVLVSGQGPTTEIARGLGFTTVTTMDQLRQCFPTLDAVDHKRRLSKVPCSFERYFPRIEGIVMFGEPVRWETSLQLIIDTLMSEGHPSEAPHTVPYPHIPVLACNMDLQWMAEACLPRFGHGAFLVCLENLYKKITGHDLIYTALVGKPSEITYRYAEHVVNSQAKQSGLETPVKTLYAIGDNLATDIYGANLYSQFLRRRPESNKKVKQQVRMRGLGIGVVPDWGQGEDWSEGATSCHSVLVQTGVYNGGGSWIDTATQHSPRDFLPVEEKLKEPTYIVKNVLEAIELIFEREGVE